MQSSTLRRHCERRLGALDRERASWFAHWRDLSTHILPRRGAFLGPAHLAARRCRPAAHRAHAAAAHGPRRAVDFAHAQAGWIAAPLLS